ncbi:MAG: MBL fold metallo-hydrolase [Phycisphaerales bacterium]|jgi:flavorubredoxin
MTIVTEIAADVFRISTFIPEADLQFNQFLIRDEEPLLFHTGLRGLFPVVQDAVAGLLDPSTIRWVGFSHFEADECGALAQWQNRAPNATAVCSFVGKVVSVDDAAAVRPARALEDDEILTTGRHRVRFLQTPQVPHAWDAGLMFEETEAVLLCSDLFHQGGDPEPATESDVVGRFRETLIRYQQGPLANYLPYTRHTEPTLNRLAALRPRVLAAMHGSTFRGDGERALHDLATVMREVLTAEV